ncbi:MAG: hypothetical protein ABL912_14605 [Novosphingobium sp.]
MSEENNEKWADADEVGAEKGDDCIRIGYGTRQDALEARVFIGVPFSTIF